MQIRKLLNYHETKTGTMDHTGYTYDDVIMNCAYNTKDCGSGQVLFLAQRHNQ